MSSLEIGVQVQGRGPGREGKCGSRQRFDGI